MKNESRFWGLAGTLPEETGKEEMGKMGITFPSCWLSCDVQLLKLLNFKSPVHQQR